MTMLRLLTTTLLMGSIGFGLSAAEPPRRCPTCPSCPATAAAFCSHENQTKIYHVADLIVPPKEQDACTAYGICAVETREPALMRALTAAVSPKCWKQNGGTCTMEYFPLGMALVIDAPASVHEQVASYLEQQRAKQDVQIEIELRLLTVSDDMLERIGIDFDCPTPGAEVKVPCCAPKPATAMNDCQARMYLEMIQGDRRSSILQAPRIMAMNGQSAQIRAIDTQTFVTGVKATIVDGQRIVTPENSSFDLGFTAMVKSTVSADRRFVRLDVTAEHSELASKQVPLFPVTTFITPKFEGGFEGKPIPFTQFIQQPNVASVKFERQMCLPDGGSMLLHGGTIEREVRHEYGPPILSKVPYVNRLFKNKGTSKETHHVYLMVTARVHDASEVDPKEGAKADQGTVPLPAPALPGTVVSRPLTRAAATVKKSPVEERASKMAMKLVERYHDACASGDPEKARSLARQALDLDPTCFMQTTPASTQVLPPARRR